MTFEIKPSYTIRKSAFSLLEILVAVAILGVASFALMELMNSLAKSNLNMQQQAEATHLHNEIYALLRNPDACLETFSNTAVDAGSTAVNSLKRANGTEAFNTTDLYAGKKLQIPVMSVGDFTLDGSDPAVGQAVLWLTITKMGEPLGPKALRRAVKLHVKRNNPGDNKVTSCVAVGGNLTSSASGGASYTAWGTTNCASGYEKAYDGVAAVAYFTGGVGSSPVCKEGANFTAAGSFSWGTGGSIASTQSISCAVCVGNNYVAWGTTSCAAGFTAAYSGYAVIPYHTGTVASSPICKEGAVFPTPVTGFYWGSGDKASPSTSPDLSCSLCVR